MGDYTKILKNINVGKLKMKNGKTVTQNLRYEAKRLMDCIQSEIDNYYNSYDPSVYKRTYRFQGALYAEDFINVEVKNNFVYINLRFHPDLAYHDSFSGKEMFVPLLINDGWCWGGYTGEEDHFRRYDGYHFLEKGIEKWNQNNSMGLKVTLDKTWENNEYSNSIYR